MSEESIGQILLTNISQSFLLLVQRFEAVSAYTANNLIVVSPCSRHTVVIRLSDAQ